MDATDDRLTLVGPWSDFARLIQLIGWPIARREQPLRSESVRTADLSAGRHR